MAKYTDKQKLAAVKAYRKGGGGLRATAEAQGVHVDSLRKWVEIQSKGGGVGINMSSLRPRGDAVKGVNGTSSGPVNWAQPFAFISKSVIIQGGSRRGAATSVLLLFDDALSPAKLLPIYTLVAKFDAFGA